MWRSDLYHQGHAFFWISSLNKVSKFSLCKLPLLCALFLKSVSYVRLGNKKTTSMRKQAKEYDDCITSDMARVRCDITNQLIWVIPTSHLVLLRRKQTPRRGGRHQSTANENPARKLPWHLPYVPPSSTNLASFNGDKLGHNRAKRRGAPSTNIGLT